MDVSVIIVNYKSSDLVIDCVESIFKFTKNLDFEVIVVDNGSQDGSLKRLYDRFGERIKLIDAEDNLGFGRANNLGASYATGRYLLLLNPDIILLNNAIYILYRYLDDHAAHVGVAGGNLYSLDLKPAPSFAERYDTLVMDWYHSTWTKLIIDKIVTKTKLKINNSRIYGFNHSEKPRVVSYIFGADFMISRKLFTEIGGFDPDFFMYSEEQELSWRIKKYGLCSVCLPDAKMIHLEGGTQRTDESFNKKQFELRMQGRSVYFLKRYGESGRKKSIEYRIKKCQKLRFWAKNIRANDTGIYDAMLEVLNRVKVEC